ncbi:hypothetical protein GM3709_3320 [Geminocystis sp. NIES-3709]|nr:hypothetical protein GM3709_3320 [Geminocystis sp. NIES-3709]
MLVNHTMVINLSQKVFNYILGFYDSQFYYFSDLVIVT